uniref:PDZ domain-containing protein n=1 Tax=Panagrellus redivivus TaxID=6233 RepID=A0A7E4UP55_PANRE
MELLQEKSGSERNKDKDKEENSFRGKLERFKRRHKALPEEKSVTADCKTSRPKEEPTRKAGSAGNEDKTRTEGSVRQRTDSSTRQRKKKKNINTDKDKPAEESSRHKEGDDVIVEPEGGASGASVRQKRNKKKPSAETGVEDAVEAKTARERRRSEPSDGGEVKTCREKKPDTESKRERKKKKHKRKEEDESKAIHYILEESDEDKKAKTELPSICTEAYGYGTGFPNWMLEVPRTISHEVKPPSKVPMVKVFKSMIVYDVPTELREHIDIGDIICKFNDQPVTTREDYTKLLASVLKSDETHTVRYTFYRTIRTRKIPPESLERTVPAGFELMSHDFDYLNAYITFVPKSQIGMNIKAYNGKVFASAIDNAQTGIARKSLLVGDAILMIDDQIVSGVKSTEDVLSAACHKKKFVRILIERAKSSSGVRQVKLALGTEKTVEINPRMGEDILDLCNEQIRHMRGRSEEDESHRSIYRGKPKKERREHVDVAKESVETPISTDVNNVTFLAPTPPVPAAIPLSEWDGRSGGYVQGTPAQMAAAQAARGQRPKASK